MRVIEKKQTFEETKTKIWNRTERVWEKRAKEKWLTRKFYSV